MDEAVKLLVNGSTFEDYKRLLKIILKLWHKRNPYDPYYMSESQKKKWRKEIVKKEAN